MTDDARFDVSYKIQNANNVLCRRKRKSLTMPSHLLFYLDAKPYEGEKEVNGITSPPTTPPPKKKKKKN
ncbi:hypothetical protein ACKS0A_05860 [Histoplasma ohiense]